MKLTADMKKAIRWINFAFYGQTPLDFADPRTAGVKANTLLALERRGYCKLSRAGGDGRLYIRREDWHPDAVSLLGKVVS